MCNNNNNTHKFEGRVQKRPLYSYTIYLPIFSIAVSIVEIQHYVRPLPSYICHFIFFLFKSALFMCTMFVCVCVCVWTWTAHSVFCIATKFFKNCSSMQTLKIENKYHCDKMYSMSFEYTEPNMCTCVCISYLLVILG